MRLLALACIVALAGSPAEDESVLLQAMQQELDRTMENLAGAAEEAPLYFLMYGAAERISYSCTASLGAIQDESDGHSRMLDIDLRVGSRQLDNTHQIRGGRGGRGLRGGSTSIPLDDDVMAIRASIWLATDRAFKRAQERLVRVKTDRAVKVDEEDRSDDFSEEEASVHVGRLATLEVEKEAWKERLRKHSLRFKENPFVYDSAVSLSATATNRFMLSTEGTKIQVGDTLLRLGLSCSTTAEDGMSLRRYHSFDARTWDKMPTDEEIQATIDRLIDEMMGLREAPLAEPYTGPAILMNRASGVFFHEIFGHRIEGHRQKSESFGQTFTKKVGEPVLPEFISVIDDPTRAEFGGADLRGHYLYDDEGVPSEPVTVVEKGVLKNFLMSRSPVKGFPRSNGHGRRQPGRPAVSRQGNLTVISDNAVPFEKLREMLVEEARKQDKEYGLIFDDISGGFTTTGRGGPQAFKVIPLVVRKVYADGRPDELVRGVDIVGTPLTSFSKIVATGDDPKIFNGSCGAESGWVPVSAISPSILVTQIEIEKKEKEQEKPPILPPPAHDPEPEE
jgi:predicted Zn-dependent protease